MKVLNILPFVKTNRGDIGIAESGLFASSAWIISDEAFESISGDRFGWTAPDGNTYEEHRSIFSRPTEDEIILKASPQILIKASKMGLLQMSIEEEDAISGHPYPGHECWPD